MNIADILLGVVTIASGVVVTAGVLLSKSNGKGLSAAIGGVGMGMQGKGKSSAETVIDKAVMIGAAACGISTLALGIIAAHL
jgi:preprotein translocase subunit SecG